MLVRSFELRGAADYGAGVTEPIDKLRALEAEVEAFVAEWESIVAEAASRGPEEPDPPPDL